MEFKVLWGIMLPFVGTVLGSGCVFLVRNLNKTLSSALGGFAGGVMIAASVWSLLIPAINAAESLGTWSFVPAVIGFIAGIVFFLFLDRLIPHLHTGGRREGASCGLDKNTMLTLAVAMHNMPEGVAVGVVFAALLAASPGVTFHSSLALALGVAIQNFPEGAIISMPLAQDGVSRFRAFLYGTLSAVVELAGAVLAILLTGIFAPLLPYLFGFAAGAMIYVVVEELIPEAAGTHSNVSTVSFAAGFAIMMVLDVVLG